MRSSLPTRRCGCGNRTHRHICMRVDADCSNFLLILPGKKSSIRCPCRGTRLIRKSHGSRDTRRILRLRHGRPLGHEDGDTAGPWIRSIRGWGSEAKAGSCSCEDEELLGILKPELGLVKRFRDSGRLILQVSLVPTSFDAPFQSSKIEGIQAALVRISDEINRHSLSHCLLYTYSSMQESPAGCKGLQWEPAAS